MQISAYMHSLVPANMVATILCCSPAGHLANDATPCMVWLLIPLANVTIGRHHCRNCHQVCSMHRLAMPWPAYFTTHDGLYAMSCVTPASDSSACCALYYALVVIPLPCLLCHGVAGTSTTCHGQQNGYALAQAGTG